MRNTEPEVRTTHAGKQGETAIERSVGTRAGLRGCALTAARAPRAADTSGCRGLEKLFYKIYLFNHLNQNDSKEVNGLISILL